MFGNIVTQIYRIQLIFQVAGIQGSQQLLASGFKDKVGILNRPPIIRFRMKRKKCLAGKKLCRFTMIPMIDDFKQRFTLGDDFVVVADSGLMNKNNVKLLQQAGYKYILGARIRNENSDVKQWILSLDKL